MAKKFTKQQHEKHQKRYQIIVGVGIIVVAALFGFILTLIVIPRIHDNSRLYRINEIYSSIQLPANTYFNAQDIFGDKRSYSYDSGRSQSSQKTFVVAKTVTDTFAEIDTAIKAAGYKPLEEAYPGSTSKEFHYKTDKGEYIRLNVSSKLRNDASSNEIVMNGKLSDAFFKIDPNAGPSVVILKVNLDDNNE